MVQTAAEEDVVLTDDRVKEMTVTARTTNPDAIRVLGKKLRLQMWKDFENVWRRTKKNITRPTRKKK